MPCPLLCYFFFFFTATATTEIYTLSLHDALPISRRRQGADQAGPLGAGHDRGGLPDVRRGGLARRAGRREARGRRDRKSTRLNSSHVKISYAVFCLKKKKKTSMIKIKNDRKNTIT